MTERYYPDPKRESAHLRGTVVFLILFFAGLLLAVTLVIVNAQRLAQTLPFSAEKSFVRPYEEIAAYFNDDEERIAQTEQVEQYLEELSASLSVHMALPADYELDVHYLNDDMTNAFAMLGGHVFVTRGLLNALETENALSLVLAHEIAHIKHRDPLAGLGRGLALQLIINFIAGQSGGGATIALSGGELSLLHFSREQESSADEAAIAAVYGHYGHVQGTGEFFEYLMNEGTATEQTDNEPSATEDMSGRLQNWLSTHPQLKARLEALDAHAQKNQWATTGSLEPLPLWLKEAVRPELLLEAF